MIKILKINNKGNKATKNTKNYFYPSGCGNKQMALTNWIIQGELRLFTMGVCRMYRKCKGQFSDPWLETAVGGYHSQA